MTKKRTSTEYIVVHCAATPSTMDIGAAEIRRWHKERGWIDIGYHFVIRRDGTVEKGRDIDAIGAHVRGVNQISVGICLVGTDEFEDAQFASLKELIVSLLDKFPGSQIKGHRDFPNVKKECPGFDVASWWKNELLSESITMEG